MGSRWAETALAVVGIICALSLGVEGTKAKAELIHTHYMQVVVSGMAKGGTCSEAEVVHGGKGAIQQASWWAGKDPKGIEEFVRKKAGEPGKVDQEFIKQAGAIQSYKKKPDKCILKQKLVCSTDKVCVECTPELETQYLDCKYVITIWNATEVEDGGGGGGGVPTTATQKAPAAGRAWMVVPVNRALLAGLVAAVFSFSRV